MIRFIPFFYFQQSRLNTKKSFAFHFAYEWIPAIVIVLWEHDFNALIQLLCCYLAFISVYEIGYILNDQSAFDTNGRIRSDRFSPGSLTFIVLIRLIAFVTLTFLTGNQLNLLWWEWYGALAAIFVAHNSIKNKLLKCVTFTQLALLRFLSPLVFLVSHTTLSNLICPVIFNYVLFRLFTYMESKSLISFNRNTHAFRIGFYSILIPFSAILSQHWQSVVPIGLNAYYLSLTLFFFVISRLISISSNLDEG